MLSSVFFVIDVKFAHLYSREDFCILRAHSNCSGQAMKQTLFEQNDGTYTQHDYLLPDDRLPDQLRFEIGVRGGDADSSSSSITELSIAIYSLSVPCIRICRWSSSRLNGYSMS